MIRSQIARRCWRSVNILRQLCSKTKKGETYDEKPAVKANGGSELPAEPDNCCMSGCANCVWIQYAKDLTEMYKYSDEHLQKIILEKIKDPSMQVFLKMELKTLSDSK